VPSRPSLTRCGLWTLPISGVMFVAGYLLNGALPDPAAGAAACMTAFGAPTFAWGAFVNLAGMLLNPCGFGALFADLSAAGTSRTAAGGMILSVLGLEVVLAGYGVVVFDLPLLGRRYVQGRDPADLGFAVATDPVLIGVLILGGLLYLVGSLLFSVALWRRTALPKWVAIGFTLSAFFLCFGPLLPLPALTAGILGSALLTASGGWVALRATRR
jgi:hypothetical protein